MTEIQQARHLLGYLVLAYRHRIKNYRPVKVGFPPLNAGTAWDYRVGVRYDRVEEVTSTEKLYTEGWLKAGSTYEEPVFYLLGTPPGSYYQKHIWQDDPDGWCQAILYRVPDDDADWYVGCHSPEWVTGPTEDVPCGPFFMLFRHHHLRPWLGRMDKFDPVPGSRPRHNLTVEKLK